MEYTNQNMILKSKIKISRNRIKVQWGYLLEVGILDFLEIFVTGEDWVILDGRGVIMDAQKIFG